MLPFGVGHFQNDDMVLGQTLLVSQLLTATASVGLFFAVESMRTETSIPHLGDLARAKRTPRYTTHHGHLVSCPRTRRGACRGGSMELSARDNDQGTPAANLQNGESSKAR